MAAPTRHRLGGVGGVGICHEGVWATAGICRPPDEINWQRIRPVQSRANTRKEDRPTLQALPKPPDLHSVGWGKAGRLLWAAFVGLWLVPHLWQRFSSVLCVCMVSVSCGRYIHATEHVTRSEDSCVLPCSPSPLFNEGSPVHSFLGQGSWLQPPWLPPTSQKALEE